MAACVPSSSSTTTILSSPPSTNNRPTLHISSSRALSGEKTRETTAIQFRECYNGIGIKVIGGCTDEASHGIFIKRLIKGGKALLDGRLKAGDQVLRVNGQTLEAVTYTESLQVLREAAASGQATLVITRDDKAQREFTVLMEDELTTASESSRATTPLHTMETSRSSEGTLKSENSEPSPHTSQSQQASPTANQSHHSPALMNNSGLTRSPSHTSQGNRQEIQRLANFFSHQLHGNAGMASTPYDVMKDTNQHREMTTPVGSLNRRTGAQVAAQTQHQQDSLFARQLQQSMHPDSQQSSMSQLTLQSDMRCSFEKLETALRFLGINPTDQQLGYLKHTLHTDNHGLISYAQFVQVAKQIFVEDLKHWTVPSTQHNSHQQSVTMTHHKPVNTAPAARIPHLTDSHTLLSGALYDVPDEMALFEVANQSSAAAVQSRDLTEEVQKLQRENFNLRKQIHGLSKQLNEQIQLTSHSEKELHKFRTEAQHALEETESVKEKLLLATESQKMASDQEQEFERLIAGLEQEIKTLKDNEAKQMESPVVRKKLAVMGSQLRKSEESRKTYQVATRKLMDFCQYVQDAMSGKLTSGGDNRITPASVALEAQEMLSLARTLLERDPLPFGWEECFDEEGARYFINHVTQETSWHHPITRQGGPTNRRIS